MKTMKSALPLAVLSCLLAIAPQASAQTTGRGAATTRDLDRLQDALANLDESLADLDPEHPRTGEFQERAADIREELVWLKVEMRRHQQAGNSGVGTSRADVEAIRKSIVDLQADVDLALRRASGHPDELVLEEGTEIQVRLLDRVTSATARPEDRIEATVAAPVRNRGMVAIPAGTRVLGVVKQAERGQRPSKAGRLELAFHAIYLDDRTRTDIRTRVVELKQDIDRGDQAKKAGIGAVLGGVLGSMIGGKEGAVIGVLAGGAGGVLAKTGEDVVLPAGTIVTLSLDRPLTVQPDETRPASSGR
ncbi:MAG TPA: hypothetical protein VFQ51_08565 [Vicinamibacteria bacterium]|nr:hypothetical protein [Vicinamibacteria bacterium]